MLAAGYQTVAFSENGLIGDRHQMLQGFEHRRTDRGSLLEAGNILDTVAEVRDFLSGSARDSDRPLFLFLNLYDPHLPYEIRSENPWVPADVDPDTLREIEILGPTRSPDRMICGALPDGDVIQILHGLYLGDVAAADAKLGRLLELVREREAGRPLITIVTSDHGEFFGERRLLGHMFSLHEAGLHVPLIVHGLPGVDPASIDQPVGLEDIVPSILRWTHLDVPDGLSGRVLPEKVGSARAGDRGLLSAFDDRVLSPPGAREAPKGRTRKALNEGFRFSCGASDRVWGRMAALTRYPYRYHWFERYPAELYDLSWDPDERSNQLALQPELASKLAAEMQAAVERLAEPEYPTAEASPEAIELLRALGYVD
jgi:arylsulfatase A-like enzyme